MVTDQCILRMVKQMHVVWNQTQTHLANLSKAMLPTNCYVRMQLTRYHADRPVSSVISCIVYTQHVTHSDFQTMQSSPAYDKKKCSKLLTEIPAHLHITTECEGLKG